MYPIAASPVGLPELFLLAIVLVPYFAPATIAAVRGHHQFGSIFVINLFLGWTFIGWVVALAMSVSHIPERRD